MRLDFIEMIDLPPHEIDAYLREFGNPDYPEQNITFNEPLSVLKPQSQVVVSIPVSEINKRYERYGPGERFQTDMNEYVQLQKIKVKLAENKESDELKNIKIKIAESEKMTKGEIIDARRKAREIDKQNRKRLKIISNAEDANIRAEEKTIKLKAKLDREIIKLKEEIKLGLNYHTQRRLDNLHCRLEDLQSKAKSGDIKGFMCSAIRKEIIAAEPTEEWPFPFTDTLYSRLRLKKCLQFMIEHRGEMMVASRIMIIQQFSNPNLSIVSRYLFDKCIKVWSKSEIAPDEQLMVYKNNEFYNIVEAAHYFKNISNRAVVYQVIESGYEDILSKKSFFWSEIDEL